MGYNPDIEQFGYHHDLDMARQLLDEAGWVEGDGGVRSKDGEALSVLFWTYSGGSEERAAQVIQNQLNQVGFDVAFEAMESATFLARVVEPDSPHNLDLSAWGWAEPDLLYLMSTVNGGFGQYRPEEYMALLNEARVISDWEQRLALYFEAMQKVLADAAMVPLWTQLVTNGVRQEVQGFKLGPLAEVLSFQDAYVVE
jgi:peptide/nickel transport system substrate-binding protein